MVSFCVNIYRYQSKFLGFLLQYTWTGRKQYVLSSYSTSEVERIRYAFWNIDLPEAFVGFICLREQNTFLLTSDNCPQKLFEDSKVSITHTYIHTCIRQTGST